MRQLFPFPSKTKHSLTIKKTPPFFSPVRRALIRTGAVTRLKRNSTIRKVDTHPDARRDEKESVKNKS